MDIYMRIISTYRSKGQELSPVQVMRWCSEVITDYLKDPAGLLKVECPLYKVSSNRFELPQDVFKLETVLGANRELLTGFVYQGDYLIFSDNKTPKNASIVYYKLAVDEDTGFPLIKKGYEPACYAYSVYKMFEEDATVIPPRVPQWRWLQIVQDKEWEIEAAHRSWDGFTDNELMEIHQYILSPDYMSIVHGQRGQVLEGGSPFGSSNVKC